MTACANYQGNLLTNSSKCPAKYKAKKKARKINNNKEKEITEPPTYQEIENEGPIQELDKKNFDLVMKIDD